MAIAIELNHERDLCTYLAILAKTLKPRHNNCNCSSCDFDSLVILAIEEVEVIFRSQILLLQEGMPFVSDLLVRSTVELIADILFIKIELEARLRKYFAFQSNFERYRFKAIAAVRESKEEDKAEVNTSIQEIEKEMSIENYAIDDNPRQWTSEDLFTKFDQIIGSGMYNEPITSSIQGQDLRMKVKFLHTMTHSSSWRSARRCSYSSNQSQYKDSVAFSIDWIMILLEFLKGHFDDPEIERALVKYYNIFYGDNR